ncbi:hypothetical protein [Agrobacterium pusense]|uniref:hypothetical protein n=1 Tax=Agrobacterium pusense TaxID=648995 RepID=UPI001C6E26A8|nr:hypothetical protein [Agrobacterium pusense]MBW9061666.1 hypothetical protein [Agrobacterium pusense]
MKTRYRRLCAAMLALIIAIPAAWAMAFSPTKRTKASYERDGDDGGKRDACVIGKPPRTA